MKRLNYIIANIITGQVNKYDLLIDLETKGLFKVGNKDFIKENENKVSSANLAGEEVDIFSTTLEWEEMMKEIRAKYTTSIKLSIYEKEKQLEDLTALLGGN